MKKRASKNRLRLPTLRTDREIAEFWDKHSLEDYAKDLKDAPEVYFERPRKQVVTLRLERPLLQRLQAIALRKGVPYSTLIRMWLVEHCTAYTVAPRPRARRRRAE